MTGTCEYCGKTFEALKPTKRFCNATCRVYGNEVRKKAAKAVGGASDVAPAPAPRPVSGLVDAVTAALEAAGRLDSVSGQHALELATRIVGSPPMSSGVAAMSKQLDVVLDRALAGSQVVVDPVDELRLRRDAKLAAG